MSKATLTIRLNSSYVLIGTTSDRLGTGAARPPAPRVSILYCHGTGAQIWAARLLGRSNIGLTTILLWADLRRRRKFYGAADLELHDINPQEGSSRLFSSWLTCRGFSLFGGLVWLGCHISLPPLLTQRRFVVGKRDSNTSPHTHLGLSCCANTCNLTAFWLSVIAYIRSSESVQAAGQRWTFRSASYSSGFFLYSVSWWFKRRIIFFACLFQPQLIYIVI